MRSWRPPSTAVLTDLPVSIEGGADGSIHDDIFVFQVPSNSEISCLCRSPGVAAFCQASIIAFCSALIWGGAVALSWAKAGMAMRRPSDSAARWRIFIDPLRWKGRGRGQRAHPTRGSVNAAWAVRPVSEAQHGTRARVADRSGRGQAAGLAFADAIEQGEQDGIECVAMERGRFAGAVGAGGYQRGAKLSTQCGHDRMGADTYGDTGMRTGDPARHARRGWHDPGVRTRPARLDGSDAIGWQRVPVQQAVEVGTVAGNEDQTLADFALLDGEQAHHRGFVEGIAAQSPHRLGRIGEDVAALQRGDGLADRKCGRAHPCPDTIQNGGLSAAAFLTAFFVTFLVAFFAAFFAGAFFAGVFVAAAFFAAGSFLAAAFLPKRPRIGLPVVSMSSCASASVSDAGSRSLGMRPLSLPSDRYGPKRPLSTWMSLPSNSLMMRLRAISSFSSIRKTARARSIVYGSSSFFSEAYTLPRLANGPKRPTPTLTSWPPLSPSLRGSLNSSSASVSSMVCIDWPGRSEANSSFSSVSLSPICAYGPYRPRRTLTGLPDLGSVPSSRAPVASLRSTDSVFSVTSSLNGPQNFSINGIHSSSPRETASSSSSSLAVKS